MSPKGIRILAGLVLVLSLALLAPLPTTEAACCNFGSQGDGCCGPCCEAGADWCSAGPCRPAV